MGAGAFNLFYYFAQGFLWMEQKEQMYMVSYAIYAIHIAVHANQLLTQLVVDIGLDSHIE